MVQRPTPSSWHEVVKPRDDVRSDELLPAGVAVDVQGGRLPVYESHTDFFALTQIGTCAPSPRVNCGDSVSKPFTSRSYGGRT